MKDYKVLGAFNNLTALQPGSWSISSSVQCCQAALQLQTLVPCGAWSSAAAYCCALQRFAEQASVDCEPAQHQAPRHHTWPGAARCVGKTDPPRPVKRGDSDSRKDHGQTKIPIPELFSKCELMDVIVCAYIHCKIYFVVSTNKIRLKHWTMHFLFVWAMPSH